jgi:hypothetical protein
VIVSAVGGAGLVTGLALGLVANGKHDAAVTEPDVKNAASLQDEAKVFGTAATVSLIAGGVLTAAGLVWLGVELLRPTPTSPTRAALVATVRGLALAGTF